MKLIQLSQGQFAQVDDEDYNFIRRWKWYFHSTGYARRGSGNKKIYMHRVINETPDGFDTDHIDGNTLNNQRCNLRTASRSDNMKNQRKWRGKSKYKGVSWFKRDSLWRVQINQSGTTRHVKYFPADQEIEAAMCYNEKAIELYGEFARLNII